MIRSLAVLALLQLASCGLVREEPVAEVETEAEFGELDADDELSEEAFEAQFGEEAVTDPAELERRRARLAEEEQEVRQENEEFLEGSKEWFERIDEYSDLPFDEFEAERTGDVDSKQFARGLLHPEVAPVDPESERYYDSFRLGRSSAPASYDSVALGHVTPVRNQKQCGSCVAFSNMAAIEVCFKKLTGSSNLDYSEQQLVDCGYGQNGASGCNGAYTYSYLKTVSDSGLGLTHESTYPYKAAVASCPSVDTYNQGAVVTGNQYTYQGTEELLEQMVAEHGAAVSSLATDGNFMDYAGGVYDGTCSTKTDHAIAVVGYGTDAASGDKYWLIKNSWGSGWGDGGYMKLKRGVGKCGIGGVIATVTCGRSSDPTSAPLTTEAPCVDQYSNCADLAKTNCHTYGEKCEKSCGLCAGMTPHVSNTCWDNWSNCGTLAATHCYQSQISSNCCLSCGLGAGMTPAASNTCYDTYSNCASLCGSSYASLCKKACGLC